MKVKKLILSFVQIREEKFIDTVVYDINGLKRFFLELLYPLYYFFFLLVI